MTWCIGRLTKSFDVILSEAKNLNVKSRFFVVPPQNDNLTPMTRFQTLFVQLAAQVSF